EPGHAVGGGRAAGQAVRGGGVADVRAAGPQHARRARPGGVAPPRHTLRAHAARIHPADRPDRVLAAGAHPVALAVEPAGGGGAIGAVTVQVLTVGHVPARALAAGDRARLARAGARRRAAPALGAEHRKAFVVVPAGGAGRFLAAARVHAAVGRHAVGVRRAGRTAG